MSRLSRFVSSVDEPSAAENDNDHRIKMYKELRRGGKPRPTHVAESASSDPRGAALPPEHVGSHPKPAAEPEMS
jgi:hypothetical protein